jgi:hypothetical protein
MIHIASLSWQHKVCSSDGQTNFLLEPNSIKGVPSFEFIDAPPPRIME